MHTLIRGLIASFLTLGLLGGSAASVQAQTADTLAVDEKPAAWTKQFEKQLVHLLWMPDRERQGRAMQLIIQYAQHEDAPGEPAFDFSTAAPRLLDIYKHDVDRGQRLLALAALNAIGDREAMQALAATVPGESSDFVRQRTLHVLSAHLNQQ